MEPKGVAEKGRMGRLEIGEQYCIAMKRGCGWRRRGYVPARAMTTPRPFVTLPIP